jgi:hypothetical protein
MNLKHIIAAAAMVSAAASAFSYADHLLISEVAPDTVTEANDGNSSEYIEIFNPTAATVSNLHNYYLTDYNGATLKYYKVVQDGPADLGTTDHIVQFPIGTSLAPGKVAIVAYSGTTFLTEFFGGNLSTFTSQAGTPQLFEVFNSSPSIPDMISFNTNATNANNLNKTNAGEFELLFYWDQTSDLVRDVDVIQWGAPTGGNAFGLKSSADTADGPDADAIASAFATDAGPITKTQYGTAPINVLVRTSSNETGETGTGGNGILNDDESTEDVAQTWTGVAVSTGSPGTTTLPSDGANAIPQVTVIYRNLEFPTSSQTITINVGTADADGNVTQARLFVNSGSGFAPVNMTLVPATTTYTATIGPYVDDTVVKYYVEITDNGGAVVLEPTSAPAEFNRFVVDNTPVTGDDLIINEIKYDDPGTDDHEFVELFNKRNTPVDISAFGFGDNLTNIGYRFPDGTIVPANGFIVLTLDVAAFEVVYGVGTVSNLLDYGTFALNNDGDNIHWIHVNSIDFNGTNDRTDLAPYTTVFPWPTGASGTGNTIELRQPNLDNSQGSNWALSTAPTGTPGAPNSVFTAAAADWQIFQ